MLHILLQEFHTEVLKGCPWWFKPGVQTCHLPSRVQQITREHLSRSTADKQTWILGQNEPASSLNITLSTRSSHKSPSIRGSKQEAPCQQGSGISTSAHKMLQVGKVCFISVVLSFKLWLQLIVWIVIARNIPESLQCSNKILWQCGFFKASCSFCFRTITCIYYPPHSTLFWPLIHQTITFEESGVIRQLKASFILRRCEQIQLQ